MKQIINKNKIKMKTIEFIKYKRNKEVQII